MSTRKEHLEYISETKGKFVVDCSHEIFTNEELEILVKYGHWFTALTAGELEPITALQREFILVATHEKEPFSIEEWAWYHYMGRKAYEAKHGDKYHVPTCHFEDDPFYNRDKAKELRSTMFKVMRDNNKRI